MPLGPPVPHRPIVLPWQKDLGGLAALVAWSALAACATLTIYAHAASAAHPARGAQAASADSPAHTASIRGLHAWLKKRLALAAGMALPGWSALPAGQL